MSNNTENFDYAVKEFIAAHKPECINTDWFDVQDHMRTEAHYQEDGRRDIEVRGHESRTGNPIVISWYEDCWQIGYYILPFAERQTRQDWTVEIVYDFDFDMTIDMAIDLVQEDNRHDLVVTEWRDGQPYQEVDIREYLECAQK